MKFTIIKSLIQQCIIIIIVSLITQYFFDGELFFLTRLGIVVIAIVYSIVFADYKIIISDNEINLYSLHRKKKKFILDDIRKVIFLTTEQYSKALGPRKKMYICTEKEKYLFVINEINYKQFYDYMDKLSAKHHFNIINGEEES